MPHSLLILTEDGKKVPKFKSNDLVMDLFNGVINPYDYLNDEQSRQLNNAMNLIDEFINLLETSNKLEYIYNVEPID